MNYAIKFHEMTTTIAYKWRKIPKRFSISWPPHFRTSLSAPNGHLLHIPFDHHKVGMVLKRR